MHFLDLGLGQADLTHQLLSMLLKKEIFPYTRIRTHAPVP